MNELKKQTLSIVTAINNDWVKALKDSEQSGDGVDTTEMFGKFSAHIEKLDQYFRECDTRSKSKRKSIF